MSMLGLMVGVTAGRSPSSPVAKKRGQDVVAVGADDQPLDRQAHRAGDVAGEDVAEIAGRHGEATPAGRARPVDSAAAK